jgi:hypothetical protein
LSGIGGVGGDLLIAGKGGIKNNLALAFAWVAIAEASEDAPVFERQDRLHRVSKEWIQSTHTEPCYPLSYQRFNFQLIHFAETLLNCKGSPDADC